MESGVNWWSWNPQWNRRPHKKSETGIARRRSTNGLNKTVSANFSKGLACPSAGCHWITVLGWRRKRLTREEILVSNNLLFFQPSAIVAPLPDPWRFDFFGAILKVTSLFSHISSGTNKLVGGNGGNILLRIAMQWCFRSKKARESVKPYMGSPQLNNQASGNSVNTKKFKGHGPVMQYATTLDP